MVNEEMDGEWSAGHCSYQTFSAELPPQRRSYVSFTVGVGYFKHKMSVRRGSLSCGEWGRDKARGRHG